MNNAGSRIVSATWQLRSESLEGGSAVVSRLLLNRQVMISTNSLVDCLSPLEVCHRPLVQR
jgi:hypothetical protein